MNKQNTFSNVKNSSAVIEALASDGEQPLVVYRAAGDEYVLIEYGEVEVDLNNRFRLHELEKMINDRQDKGILETIPGVRSLLVKFNPEIINTKNLVKYFDLLDIRKIVDVEFIEKCCFSLQFSQKRSGRPSFR